MEKHVTSYGWEFIGFELVTSSSCEEIISNPSLIDHEILCHVYPFYDMIFQEDSKPRIYDDDL